MQGQEGFSEPGGGITLKEDMVVATLGPVVIILRGHLVKSRFLRIQIPNHNKDPYNKMQLRGAGPGKELTRDSSGRRLVRRESSPLAWGQGQTLK